MSRIPINTIDIKYRVPLIGEYNIYVNMCEDCRSYDTEIIGFAEMHGTVVAVCRCMSCFAPFWHHASKDLYESWKDMKENE